MATTSSLQLQPPSNLTTTLTPSQYGAITTLTALLHTPLRITILDNRIFIGIFICVDPQCNLLLGTAEEFLPPPMNEEEAASRKNKELFWPKSRRSEREGEGWGGRQVGNIMIPGKVVVKVEVQEGWESRDSGVK